MSEIRIVTTPRVLADLKGLVATGLFGRTVGEVAEELLRARLREVVLERVNEKEFKRLRQVCLDLERKVANLEPAE